MDAPYILTAAEAAAYLKLQPQLLAKWRHYKSGPPYFKPSPKTVLYSHADLDAWLAATKRTARLPLLLKLVAPAETARNIPAAFCGA